jgi:hypothetical protein
MRVQCGRCSVSLLMISLAGLPAVAQDGGKPVSSSDTSEYIKIARANAETLRFEDMETGAEIERVENPVFRYTEPVRGPTQGAMWLWGQKGRPVAVLEMIREGNLDWYCFHATSDKPFKLSARSGEVWTPKSSDLRFQPLPNAPPPAESPAHRMRQMKEFVLKFTAHEYWVNGRHEMRILPAAVHRYEDQDQRLIDGAIFVIAVGTHPEATLFLEAVQPADGAKPIWKFAIGRSGAAEMVVKYNDKEVHHLPLIEKLPPPTSTYWRMILTVEEK